jgi:hypothetical protein
MPPPLPMDLSVRRCHGQADCKAVCVCVSRHGQWRQEKISSNTTAAGLIDSLDQGAGLKSSSPPPPLRPSYTTAGMMQPTAEMDICLIKGGSVRFFVPGITKMMAVMPRFFCSRPGHRPPSKTRRSGEITSTTLLAQPLAAARQPLVPLQQ